MTGLALSALVGLEGVVERKKIIVGSLRLAHGNKRLEEWARDSRAELADDPLRPAYPNLKTAEDPTPFRPSRNSKTPPSRAAIRLTMVSPSPTPGAIEPGGLAET